ncbi:class I SAM-dependent methyltransferase [Brucella rhizosphaerae]|uniref:Methionine biosynthesis MetW family protein n=1 Tax=Brucella rhizosphaerae TaxID=571254 RepID=A0A256EZQ3_9HYPH|nr:class I SAM-dependent methyltransferase [Brucella rhizosphaerae]OYR08099.1 methionine biosynthesis MetW family protein [Brucella rhizosphaerae]
MSEERMHLESDHYDPFYASQHVGRYEILRSICTDKVVLDIACGEGYGSALLSKWGAKEVVGVDVSEEAINNAIKLFASDTVNFHQYDAHQADKLLKRKKFDLVACFETIEHLQEPVTFLKAIKKLLNKGAIIAISCPNEKNDFSIQNDNPFHLGVYTLDEFKSLTEGVLGKASGWLFGTPTQGMINVPVNDKLSLKENARLLDILDASEVSSASVIPPASHVAPSETNCFYFVGLWGVDAKTTSVISTLSYPSFISPWKKIEFLEQSLASKFEVVETLNKRLNELRSETSLYKTKVSKLARELNAERLFSGNRDSGQSAVDAIQQLKAEVEMYRQSKFVRVGRKINRLYELPGIGHALRAARKVANVLIR